MVCVYTDTIILVCGVHYKCITSNTHTHTLTHSGSLALQQLLESVTEAKKFETENAHKWKQIKHLLKYVKNQEKEITKTERLVIRMTSTHFS